MNEFDLNYKSENELYEQYKGNESLSDSAISSAIENTKKYETSSCGNYYYPEINGGKR